MMTLPEIQVLMTIISEWQDRAPMKVFAMGKGGDLQSALAKLQQMADEAGKPAPEAPEQEQS